MNSVINPSTLDQLFRSARSYSQWEAEPVAQELLRQAYELAALGPTSMNCQPARFFFLCTQEARERLVPMLASGNVDKVRGAAATVIVATDPAFYEQLPYTFPHAPQARDMFANQAMLAEETAMRNGSLTGGYFILALRALGLDVGPMSGFDRAKVDAEFLADTGWRSNFLLNVGVGRQGSTYPRQPRLSFEEACRLL